MDDQIELFRDDYALTERVSAKARNIRIEVRPDRGVTLVYPRWVGRAEAHAFLRAREAWIREKLAELAQQASAYPLPARLRWDGDDRISLRGESYALKAEAARLRSPAVRVESQRVVVLAPSAVIQQPARLDAALRQALVRQARLDAQTYLQREAPPLGVRYRELRINDAQTQWGSCNPGGTICLSWRLVMAPPEVFRYVVVHELCHLVHMDHSPRFWSLVERQMADYEQHKRWLRDRGHQLHAILARERR
ncbi:M48 family metallopeptidase [Solimonas marina]|uniref:M48 family metallopeptidase n=1 Tax=Solimonas marina TaxID=2714601 RepID=A0A970B8D3_9GAMM|nr:SprT family zinc-dependent metalloprotease [Solimonas marina]NKF22164.1 M48 family metallopeptidase [Solimonas marina]